MRRTFWRSSSFVVSAIVLVSGLGWCLPAQAQQSADADAAPGLVPGAWAMQFQVNSDFTLGSFQGSLFSAKRHYSAQGALRFGLSVDVAAEDREGDSRRPGSSADRYGGSVLFQILRYPAVNGDIRPFFGIGPRLSYTRSTTETGDDRVLQSSTGRSFGAGLEGVVGVEWFFRPNLSLSGEYGLSVHYARSTQESVRPRSETRVRQVLSSDEIERYGIGDVPVKLGLSFYF